MSICISNATVVTADGAFRVIKNGAVWIEGGRIVAVGPSEEVLARRDTPKTHIDASGRMLLPGFVSAHNHLGYTVFRGRAEDVGATPTPSLFLPMKQVLAREERAVFGTFGAAEMLKSGVTTVLQMEEDTEVLIDPLKRLGIRAGVAIMTNDIKVSELMQGKYVFDSSERESQLRRSESLIEHLQACGGRLVPFVSGNMALSCSPELLRGLRGLADKHGVRLSYHVGLGAYEVDLVQEMHRMTPFRFARECGFLGPESVVAHCHYMNAEDLDLLAESGANVVHCPVLNSLRGAAAPIEDMLARDINVCLGLDNYFGDPFDVMRACISVARVRNKDATFLSATDALRFFTINAARAMGMDKDIGSIEVGKKADLQLVNLKGFGTSPVTDPVSTLVYHGHSSNVDTVLVDGEFVVREGELLTDSEEKLVNEVQEVSDRVWKRFSERFPELTGEQKAASQ